MFDKDKLNNDVSLKLHFFKVEAHNHKNIFFYNMGSNNGIYSDSTNRMAYTMLISLIISVNVFCFIGSKSSGFYYSFTEISIFQIKNKKLRM